jgi:hypothetical protein
LPLARFNGVGDEKLCGIFHETIKDKGPNLAFRSLKSSPPIDAKDTKVSPLHMSFNLKGVLVKKDHFKINHFLPLLFNLAWGYTLLGKNIVPRPCLKEFFLRCLKQFTIYICTFAPLGKMNPI